MELIGKALARLAHGMGGQFLLELPDDLPPGFVAGLVNGANHEVAALPTYAIFVAGGRKDVNGISPRVGFRELAMYRQGNRLAVTYASENRGMATYSSVYPLLLANGFPAADPASGGMGVVGFDSFALMLARVIESEVGRFGMGQDGFQSAVAGILQFLANAYQVAGNGQASFVADWWLHINSWVDGLVNVTGNGPDAVRQLYGCAGLPVPEDGFSLKLDARDYVSVLTSRWSNPSSVVAELARLEGIQASSEGATTLSGLDWETSFARASLSTDSPVARVARGDGLDPTARMHGWSGISEAEFKQSYVLAKDKLRIRKNGDDLIGPWQAGLPVVRVATGEELMQGSSAAIALELVLPLKEGGREHGWPEIDQGLLAGINVSGARGTTASFDVVSASFGHDGLVLAGELTIELSKRSRNILGLEAHVSGTLANFVANMSSGRFTVVWPQDIALWIKPIGKARRGTIMGPFYADSAASIPVRVEVPKPGVHDFAMVWGGAARPAESSVSIGQEISMTSWPGMDGASALVQAEVVPGLPVKIGGHVAFELSVASTTQSPRSPFVAAARGISPDSKKNAPESILEHMEREYAEVLANLEPGHALGCIVLAASEERRDLETHSPGALYSPVLLPQLAQVSPGLPSQSLLSLPSYIGLLEAYRNLGVPELADYIEEGAKDVSLIFSQLPLVALDEMRVNALLLAYEQLLNESSTLGASDRFWARNPFSIAVVPTGYGSVSAQAVLLSPLHPIRLAWAWRVQAGLREAYDDGLDPDVSLSLLDGTFFPAYCVVADAFGEPNPFLPIRVDAHPDDLYLGWHASVAVVSHSPVIPEWIDGRRFPADGLSGLSEGSVGAAIDDFVRVSPHVHALKVALSSSMPAARSASIDQGVLGKIRDLAMSSSELDGISGVRVFDSASRLGPLPGLALVEDAFPSARPGFNVEWSVVGAGMQKAPHITFLEGNASKVSLSPSVGPAQGWLGHVPVRRTPQRARNDGFSTIGFGLAQPDSGGGGFSRVVHGYERDDSSCVYSLRISPNMAGITSKPNWLIAGDFGVDPKTLSTVASKQSAANYVLWDWRPTAAIKGKASSGRLQPYFVLAAVPAALNRAISNRLRLLKDGIDQDEVGRRANFLISTLAERAIGLNTLLAIGHHQATGALGFFFALRCTAEWLRTAPEGEVRLLIPIDAVDPFLRGSGLSAPDGSRKRADLLAVRMTAVEGTGARIVLAPIEIKHYGLSTDECEVSFPKVGEARLEEHLEQLRSYQAQLVTLCDSYRDSGRGAGQFIAERLVAILDAALQLNPDLGGAGALGMLRSVSERTAEVLLGKGVLMWFQAKGTTQSNDKAAFDEVGGAIATQRVELRIDPVAFDDELWDSAPRDCLAYECVSSALASATLVGEAIATESEAPFASQVTVGARDMSQGDPTASGQAQAQDAPPSPTIVPKADLGTGMPKVQGNAELPIAPSVAQDSKRMPDEVLENRYGELLNALREFNVKVERPRGERPYREGPAFVEFSVAPAYGVSVSRIESQLPNVKLRLRLPAEANIGCATHMGNVVLTVPKPDHERYFVDAMELWSRTTKHDDRFSIPVAEDIGGNVVEIDLSNSNSPHLLIAGVTGSGKSEALLTILHGAAHFYGPDELRLKLIDPKQTELLSLAELPHTDGAIGSSGEEAIEILNEAVEEMERRYTAFKAAGIGVRNIRDYQDAVGPMPRWIIVLDEYADLISDDAERKLIEKSLQRLSQKARAAGIHVIVSTQKPIVKVIDTVVKGNLPGKIALRVNTAMESRVILDEDGAQDLTGKGDAIVKAGNGRVRVQFARYAI